jgi:membrane fusion protein
MQEIVSAQVALRQQSLREEVTRLRRLQVDEESALHRKIDGLQAEQSKTAQQIASQQERVQLAEDGVARTSQLLSHGYVSAEVAQQKQADLLDQRTRLEALQRDKLSADRELESQRNELTSLPLRQQNDLAQLQRLLASTEQEWTESEGKRRFAVLAPGGGIATAILAEVGQTVDLSRPLMSIMPADAVLQAYLYAPSSAIGFIRTNDHVLLRYQAYPYQKFGHATGRVSSVSRVALSLNEAVGNQHGNNGDPVYLVTVALDRQTITAYGRTQPLQAGMRVDADVLQEKRSLFEWVMEPLYSLSGKL